MEDGFRLRDATIGIFGLGLMGGSLAMGLKGNCARIIGFDSDPSTLELALSKNIIDQAGNEIKETGVGVKVDLLILATPVPTIISLIQRLPSVITPPCIVMDIGSTKREILKAMSNLPENFAPIGAHPICGKEKLGLENADANIYQNAPFVITSSERTTSKADSAARQVISAVGARCVEMTAEEHDRVLALTSHLPFLIASSLAHSTPPENSPLIGSGFRSTSRIAGTPSSMMMGVLKSNRDNILHSIEQFRNSLGEIELALQAERYTELENILNRSRNGYLSLTGHH